MSFSFNIRFYEELNDFLPLARRKKSFSHTCFGTPSIKDVIESLGVPHTEVDLILVNSEPADFEYRPVENDFVSVYPVFESLDISPVNRLRPEPLRVSRFVADVHLGRLARYLRMMGFDTVYRNDLEDNEIIEMAVKEKRIVLTRDLQMLKNNQVTHGYYVRSSVPDMQAREVIQRFDLSGKINPFHRCIECNGIIRRVSKDKILHLLQPRTLNYFNDFFRCRECMRIYWKGSHYDRMSSWLENILNSSE